MVFCQTGGGGRGPEVYIRPFQKFFFLELRLRLWIFFSLGPIETMFRKYTFHKNRFFYPHRAKNGQKMAKNDQKKFWPKNFGFLL